MTVIILFIFLAPKAVIGEGYAWCSLLSHENNALADGPDSCVMRLAAQGVHNADG